MCQFLKRKIDGNKGVLISFMISLTFGVNNKKKELNTNLSQIQEGNNIVSCIPDRIRIIENLCKLVILEKEDTSRKKLVIEKKVYFKVN